MLGLNTPLTEEQKNEVEYQTHLVCLNLVNTQRNYLIMQANEEYFNVIDDYDFKFVIRNDFKYYDDIKWKYVNFNKVKAYIVETLTELRA